jgi:hypothetical protein
VQNILEVYINWSPNGVPGIETIWAKRKRLREKGENATGYSLP